MRLYTATTSCVLESDVTLSRRTFVGSAFAFATAVGLGAVAAPNGAQAANYALGDMVIGDENAAITIIEYASFTCPHCATFHEETLPRLKEAWIDTGKAKLIFRDFPFDEMALRASMLARCAGPDRYFTFVDVLFKQQRQWARSQDPVAALGRIARLGGINGAEFEACMADQELGDSVLRTRLEGAQKYDVRATPTLIINGEKHAGAMRFEEMDSLLRKLSP